MVHTVILRYCDRHSILSLPTFSLLLVTRPTSDPHLCPVHTDNLRCSELVVILLLLYDRYTVFVYKTINGWIDSEPRPCPKPSPPSVAVRWIGSCA